MKPFVATLLLVLALAGPFLVAQARGSQGDDEFALLLERLRNENGGEYAKVVELAKTDRPAAMRFLRERFGIKGVKTGPEKKPEKDAVAYKNEGKPVRCLGFSTDSSERRKTTEFPRLISCPTKPYLF
jgi:hypothetical protein